VSQVRILPGSRCIKKCKCYNIAMNTFMVSVVLQVEVEAFDESDARDAVEDCFGEGDFCGISVADCEVTDLELLP
jgi:hypothetical protein